MSHSPLFDRVIRALRLAREFEHKRISTREGFERVAEAQSAGVTRRKFLGAAGAGALALTIPSRLRAAGRGRPVPVVDVGIVGGGLAGLTCADTLREAGVHATIYESSSRLGGRQWSMGGSFGGPVNFPGQVIERGGELLDNLHKTLLGYANEFGLAKEDLTKEWLPGETTYYFGGQHVAEEAVVDEFRELVDQIRPDLTQLSSEVTAQYHTEFDEALDRTSLADYLLLRGAGPYARAAVDVSYNIEYGLEIDQQSCLNFLFFMHIDKRSRFQPFGVFSDERYHIIGGNEQIARNIAERLPGPALLETRLLRMRKTSSGLIELTVDQNGQTVTRTHEAVVLALPFSSLRNVELDSSLALPPEKQIAISDLRYGTNAKLMAGFNGRFWGQHGSEGVSYSDLPNHQNTWEANPIAATAQHATIVDYTGGNLGARLDARRTQQEARLFLADLDKVWPGALAAASIQNNKYIVHIEDWPNNPNIRGSYTCNHPGYFTTIAGNEGTPAGNIYFAGEHSDSFYEWQGFMEGAANSGIRAANEILASV